MIPGNCKVESEGGAVRGGIDGAALGLACDASGQYKGDFWGFGLFRQSLIRFEKILRDTEQQAFIVKW